MFNSDRLSLHVLWLCIIACVPSILHVISLSHNSWHHTNAYISFMHHSDRDAGERDRRAHRVRWARARCWVGCWPRREPRQAAKHDPLCLFKLMQFIYLTWVLLGYIYIILFIAFLYLLLCITLPWYCLSLSLSHVSNYIPNMTRCLAMLKVFYITWYKRKNGLE